MGGDSYMDLHSIEGEFSVCKVGHYTADMLERPFSFLAVTDTEKSLICPTEVVPEDTLVREDHWNCFRIAEDAAFSKYGMIAFLADIIAAQKTATLVVGTYDTDYLFIQRDKFPLVKQKLIEAGCRFL
jgi:hypothetical protein